MPILEDLAERIDRPEVSYLSHGALAHLKALGVEVAEQLAAELLDGVEACDAG